MKGYMLMLRRFILFLPVLIVFILVLNEEVRSQIRGILSPHDRQILSVVSGQISPKTFVKIIKIRAEQNIVLEVYEIKGHSDPQMLGLISLNDRRDGYVNFGGRAINLAIEDVDQDGQPEILAPSFDENLVAHLNIFKFDPVSKSFRSFK